MHRSPDGPGDPAAAPFADRTPRSSTCSHGLGRGRLKEVAAKSVWPRCSATRAVVVTSGSTSARTDRHSRARAPTPSDAVARTVERFTQARQWRPASRARRKRRAPPRREFFGRSQYVACFAVIRRMICPSTAGEDDQRDAASATAGLKMKALGHLFGQSLVEERWPSTVRATKTSPAARQELTPTANTDRRHGPSGERRLRGDTPDGCAPARSAH